jgi:NTE family protein
MDTAVKGTPAKTKPAASKGAGGETMQKKRVGLAVQGGSFLAGAVATGVVKVFVEERVFERYDVRMFSGTSAGALVATACWSHAMRSVMDGVPLQTAMTPLPSVLKRMWLHNAKDLFALVPNQQMGDFYKTLDGTLRHMPPWEWFVQNVRAPLLRNMFRQWIREYLPRESLKRCVKELHDRLRQAKRDVLGGMTKAAPEAMPADRDMEGRIRDAFAVYPDLPRLVLGSADVLKGEIMGFNEYDVAAAADDAFREALAAGSEEAAALEAAQDAGVDRLFDFIEASGSLEELNGSTTIDGGPYAGTYYDGAWGQNPPVNDLLDYAVNQVWLVEIFPKERPTLPATYAEREDRKEELLQNALVQHQRHIIEKVNEWIRSGRFITNYEEYQAFLQWKAGRGETVAEPIECEDEFQTYHVIATKRMPMTIDFTPGARMVNYAPFLRDKMQYGEDNARQFLSGLE